MRRLVLLSSFIALSGCASITDRAEWDCGSQEGFGCQSIHETANRILGGSRKSSKVTKFKTSDVKSQSHHYTSYSPDYGVVSTLPKWEQNDILKIHIMPFVDGVNSYHEKSVIYSVVSAGGWSRD